MAFVFLLLRQYSPVQVIHWFFFHWTLSKLISPFQLQLRVWFLLFVHCFLQFQGMVAGEISRDQCSKCLALLCVSSICVQCLVRALPIWLTDWGGLCFIPDFRVRLVVSPIRENPRAHFSHPRFSPAVSAPPLAKGGGMLRLSVQPALLYPVWNVEAILRALLPSLCGGWGSFVRSLCPSIVCCSSPCDHPVLQVHRPFSCLAAYGFCFVFLSFYKFLLAFTLVTCC